MIQQPYDNRLNRNLRNDDLPEGVTVRLLAVFLKAHDLTFYSLDIFDNKKPTATCWWREEERFRVSTRHYPPRGVNITFGAMYDWMAQVEDMNPRQARRQLGKMKECLAKLEASRLTAAINSLHGATIQLEDEIAVIEEAQAAMKEIADVRA